MKALVGLGNPGPEYVETRHNLGFRLAEAFAARHRVKRFHTEGSMLAARVRVGGEEVVVVKPRTFMNRSGVAVRELATRYAARGDDLLVAHDDLDLDLGMVRIKIGGGHGGHNGLRSIIEDASAGEFVRIRLGIKRPEPGIDAAEWVLESFSEDELGAVGDVIERGVDAVDALLRNGSARAMNEFNRRPERATAPAGETAGETAGKTG